MTGTAGKYKLETTINEFGRYMWAFTLYCAGRQTYAPRICEEVMRDNAEIILYPWRANIIAHVMGRFASTFEQRVAAEKEQREAKAAGDPDWWQKGYKGGPLGADFDENGWMKAVSYLAKHDEADPVLVNANWDGEDAPVTATFDDVDDFWFMVGSAVRHDLAGDEGSVMTPAEHTAFVKAHANDLNPKWVTNLWRDVTDEFWGRFASATGDGDAREKWAELRDFLEEVATPEAREPWEARELRTAPAGDGGPQAATAE